MPLETATYLSQLVVSNPANSDPLSQADDHMRLIKATVKTTFPNFTAAALTSTQAQLDGAALAVNTDGVSILADAGAHFKTNATDKITNPVAGEIDIAPAGVAQLKISASAVQAIAPLTGPGTFPIGGMIMWTTDTLPTGNGVWAWANGGTLSRTTPGAGKELYDRYVTDFGSGTIYGAGNGTTTFNVIDMQDVVPVGKDTMGGAASPGWLPSISSGLKGLIGKLFGADTVTMARSDMPNVAPTFTGNSSGQSFATSQTTQGIANGGGAPVTLLNGVTFTPAATPTGTVQSLNGGVTQTAMNNLPPSRTVNFIIRIA